MKKCSKCNQIKSRDDFYKRESSKDGLRSHCKECIRLNKNVSAKRDYDHCRYVENKEFIDTRAVNYYHKHKEEKARYDKSIRQQTYEKRRIRYSTDLNYKITCNLRSRLHVALKRNKKHKNTMDLLGCSIDEFIKHIELKFDHNMCWNDVMTGKIHIDHIRPCSSFDLTNKSQQEICFHYSNLQPLWAKDNFKKSSKH